MVWGVRPGSSAVARRAADRWWLLVAALVGSSVVVVAAANAAEIEWLGADGYVKSFVVGFDQKDIDIGGAAVGQEFLWANNNRGRLNLGVSLGDTWTLRGSYDLSLRIQHDALFSSQALIVFPEFPIYRFADLENTLWPDSPGEGDHVALFQNLDRLQATVSLAHADIIAGRQVIAWGSAHAINPTDILGPFLYNEIDVEDRVGVDALRVRVPTGNLGELDAGYVAGEDFAWKESAAFVRSRFYVKGSDATLLAMAFRENVLAGIDITRAVGGAGTWLEAAQVWGDALRDGKAVGASDYLRLSLGADYHFNVGNGIYGFIEYHYNGAGVGEASRYVDNALGNRTAYVDGAVYLLGRNYVIPGASYQLTPLITAFVESLVNLSDGSFILTPYVEYNMTENIYLSVGGYGAFGSGPSVQGTSLTDAELVLGSEFGAYPTQYYAFVRYYY